MTPNVNELALLLDHVGCLQAGRVLLGWLER